MSSNSKQTYNQSIQRLVKLTTKETKHIPPSALGFSPEQEQKIINWVKSHKGKP